MLLRNRALRQLGITATAARGQRPLATAAATPSHTVVPIHSVLIANRGEIALRVRRTASDNGYRTTVLYTDPDKTSQHALSSPSALNLGDPSRYLDGDHIIKLAKANGCDAIHPGYGFLSENADFAQKCVQAGLNFIGPPAAAVDAMGDKSRSKDIMNAAGVPCIPGYHGSSQDPTFLAQEADKIGYPVLLKAVKGGGGKGMRIATTPQDFTTQLESAKSEARSSFGNDVMLVEKYITTPRHIEVQVFADKHGNCVALGERDCSIQRRHQKILEESPAPHLPEDIRQDLWEKARAAALAVDYEGAGTVEFIFDNDTGKFFFMEMNTRLQVEHPVTEMVTGQDLVHWQLLVAQGHPLPLTQEQVDHEFRTRGHAIEARIYAEDPTKDFFPDSGTLLHLQTPTPSESVRIDAGFVQGDLVSPFYDPMIAKLIVSGPDRKTALLKLRTALEQYQVAGLETNIDFLKRMCISPDFVAGQVETGYIQKHRAELFAVETVSPDLWTQAALAFYLLSDSTHPARSTVSSAAIGFTPVDSRTRSFNLSQHTNTESKSSVTVTPIATNTYNVSLADSVPITVTAALQSTDRGRVLQTFFPHTRLDTTIVPDPESDVLTFFQNGQKYRIKLSTPAWITKLSTATTGSAQNALTAPMPCKILRVEVEPGATVEKNQPLVVIESMKMETVVRAPGKGTVEKVLVGAGELCKAGRALVEFVADGEDA